MTSPCHTIQVSCDAGAIFRELIIVSIVRDDIVVHPIGTFVNGGTYT